MGLDQLCICLWEEQAALDELAFRLDEELLVLASGRHHWLTRTTAEVAVAFNRLCEVERRRMESARLLGDEVGVSGEITLTSLAEATDPESARTLIDHRDRLRVLLSMVQQLAERNRSVLARNLAATTDALACMGAAPLSSYNAGGASTKAKERSWLVDAKV